MAITTKKQRQQRRNEALQLISSGVPPTDPLRGWISEAVKRFGRLKNCFNVHFALKQYSN